MLKTNAAPFEPGAFVLCDSQAGSYRLTTFVVTFHRYVLAEFNTHRAFSRNGASSRAIPVEKLVDKVLKEQVQPPVWGSNQPGMQAGPEVTEEVAKEAALVWDLARQDAVRAARQLHKLGIHKQVVNRLLEPFLPMTMIVTSLDAGLVNFFNQRKHPSAAPEMQELATAMYNAYSQSQPVELEPGQWHLPYALQSPPSPATLLACAGRCARVSYLNHNGQVDLEADANLGRKLLTAWPHHLSPFEHLAQVQPHLLLSTGNFNHSPFLQLRHNHFVLQTLEDSTREH